MSYQLTSSKAKEVIRKTRSAIKEYFDQYGQSYAIFGKSMGLDSSVIAGLLSDISGIKPIGVITPIESDPEDFRIAKKVLDHFKTPFVKVDLTEEYHAIAGRFYREGSIRDQLVKITTEYKNPELIQKMAARKVYALGNIKARLRMITLYHVAQLTGGIVISADNYSEWWMGFWTLNGDVGDFAPIQQIFKGLELYTLARALGVPEESIKAKPTDGLDVIPGGGDEDQLGLPYEELDPVIIELLKADYDNWEISEKNNIQLLKRISKQVGHSLEKIEHVAKQMKSTHFKRRVPVQVSREKLGLPQVGMIKL